MIITVTLNAAIDKTLAVPNFRLARRHRAIEQRALAGGKGVNVARALKSLGQPVIATGFAGGPTGTRIIEQLTDEAILNDFVRIHDESRTSTAVVDPASGEQTEINEYGPEVSDAELDLFRDKLLYLAKGAGVCVFCGSLPRGAPPSLYAELVQDLRKVGVTTVLDSEGEALDLATRAEPTVVTPNELEAEELVGHEFADDEDRLTAVSEIVELGAHEAVMTMETGCIALVEEAGATQPDSGKRLYRCTLEPQDTPVSRVGSGDAFLAGYVASRYGGGAPEDGLRFAVACGAESTQHFGAGVLDAKAVERLAVDVEVESLSEPALEPRG
jgi:1-phosphofructokinase/tagatose 6-phosphate kinase